MMNTIAPKNVMNLGVTTEMNRANENIKEKRPMFWEMTTVNINAQVKVMKSSSDHMNEVGKVVKYD